MSFPIEELLQKFSQNAVLEDILPTKLGVRACGLSEIGEDVPFIAEWLNQALDTEEMKTTLRNPFFSYKKKNQVIWRYSSLAEKAVNDKLRDEQTIKTLKNEHGIYTKIMIHPVRGKSLVGCFKYYDNSSEHDMVNLMAGLFFFSYGNVPDKIREIKNLRRKAIESLDGGVFATANSIECVRREEDMLGELLAIPECCRKAFTESKRNRETFLLRFAQLSDAREIRRRLHERCEKIAEDASIEEESTLLHLSHEEYAYGSTEESEKRKLGKTEILGKYKLTKDLKLSLFKEIVEEKKLEEKLGVSFELPLKHKVMSELQNTDGWRYVVRKAIKEKDDEQILDSDAINDLANEDLPSYLFSCFAAKVYPCRYDCEKAISMFQRMYDALCSIHPSIGKSYKASILSNTMRI